MMSTLSGTLARAVVAPLAVVALALSLSLGLLGSPAQAASAQSYGKAAVKATNAVRREHDLHPLKVNACLQSFAQAQATRMAEQRRIFHQDIGVVLRRCGLTAVGENVAEGYRSGRGVVRNGWMHSAGHRANILNRSYRLIAVVARKGSDGRWYASQVFGRG
jgi:uncharacterized protein YkwD